MNYKLLLLFLLLTTGKSLTAQEIFQPIIAHYGDNLVYDNFPAISEDGSHYLVIYNQYSCCIDLGDTLKRIRSSDGEVLDEIILSPSEEAVQFMIDKQKSIYENVKKHLESDSYFTLTETEKFETVKNTIDNTIRIKVNASDKVYTSEKFTFSQIGSNGYCCNGGTDMNEHCFLDQTIVNVSLGVKHGIFLIETGVIQQFDGCDQGPFYKIISITKD